MQTIFLSRSSPPLSIGLSFYLSLFPLPILCLLNSHLHGDCLSQSHFLLQFVQVLLFYSGFRGFVCKLKCLFKNNIQHVILPLSSYTVHPPSCLLLVPILYSFFFSFFLLLKCLLRLTCTSGHKSFIDQRL